MVIATTIKLMLCMIYFHTIDKLNTIHTTTKVASTTSIADSKQIFNTC